MKSIIIIPARMGSSRFPNKPLAEINGIPMIGHCYYRSIMSKRAHSSYVATPDKEIYQYIKKIGGNVIMTSKKHKRATDRTTEAMIKIEKKIGKVDIVILLQGDEPMITPEMLDNAIKVMTSNKKINVINFITLISKKEAKDKNEIKVLKDRENNAIYFSRNPLPHLHNFDEKINLYKQVCIIPFNRKSLLKFNETKETILEKAESIDMLRLIENQINIKLLYNKKKTYSVDTLKDLKRVSALMKDDPLIKKYN